MFGFIKKHRFKQEVETALATGVLTEAALENLRKRSNELGIDSHFLVEQRQKDYRRRAAPIIERVQATRRFSPADEAELLKMANALHVNASFESEFSKYRALWTYENTGEVSLSVVPSSIILQKGEECYFRAGAEWKQLSTIRVKQGYSGVGVSFRVAKGVRLYSGHSAPRYTEHQGLKSISPGELYATNKRLIFSGAKKSENVQYKKIIDIQSFQNGVEIIKETGKPDYFEMTQEDAELICIILRKLMAGHD